jgi:hypothetical protein
MFGFRPLATVIVMFLPQGSSASSGAAACPFSSPLIGTPRSLNQFDGIPQITLRPEHDPDSGRLWRISHPPCELFHTAAAHPRLE